MPMIRYSIRSTVPLGVVRVACRDCEPDPRPTWPVEHFVADLLELYQWISQHELTAHVFTVPMPVLDMEFRADIAPDAVGCPAFHAAYGTCVGPRGHAEMHMNVFGQRWEQNITPTAVEQVPS